MWRWTGFCGLLGAGDGDGEGPQVDSEGGAGPGRGAGEQLAARDTVDQWLVTFGVTTSDKKDLSRLESNSDRFGVPWSEECRGEKTAKDPQYCVNGSTISDDAGYWVATSDHIANDPAVYAVLKAEPSGYHKQDQVKLTREG